VTDIPGAFLHVDMKDTVHMVLEGTISELLLNLNWQYTRNTHGITRKESLCSMYISRSHLMVCCRPLSDTLIGWGFTINPYYKCVANKVIKGKQCTVIW